MSTVNFHWYWPFARPEELAWARATARPGESVTVQVVDRPQAPPSGGVGPVTVVRDLPDVRRDVGGLQWATSRVDTYRRRSRARSALWRQNDFDLVHLHYLNRFTDAVVRLPSPVVLSVHDVVPHRPRLGAAERAVLGRVYHRGDALVVHHDELRVQLVEEFGVDPAKVHVVAHQVFTTPVVAGPPETDVPEVLFFGALRHNKGLEVLLDALERLPMRNLRLRVAGRGDREVEEMALRAAGRDPRVHVELGFANLDRKRQLFKDASVVVLPYTSFASQSGVLHDAYGHGRPVVVTEVGALGRSVREDGTGLVAQPGDADDLARSIEEALVPGNWQRFSRAAELVREARSPQRTGERLRLVYDQVLAPAR